MLRDIHTHPDSLYSTSVMGLVKLLILSLLIIFSMSFSCFRYTVQGKEILRKSITYHLGFFWRWGGWVGER